MVSFDFCGQLISCSLYFIQNNLTNNVTLNGINYHSSWLIDINSNESTVFSINETNMVFEKGNMVLLQIISGDVNLSNDINLVLSDFSFNAESEGLFSVSDYFGNVSSQKWSFCVRALTTRYYYKDTRNFSIQFNESGTYDLLAVINDPISTIVYFEEIYFINGNILYI